MPATSIPHEPEPGCDFLQLTSGTLSSGPLLLPGNAIPGKKEVKVQRGHFEVKIPTTAYSSSPSTPSLNTTPQAGNSTGTDESLLDASQLSASNPTTFICASCSLPLIHSSRISDYRDLPSEHWEELVEAWMCHSDQKLHEHVTKHSRRGFWPKEAQALVGGSYILFESSAINGSNLYASAELKVRRYLIISRLGSRFPSFSYYGRIRRPTLALFTNDRFYISPPSWVTGSMGDYGVPANNGCGEDVRR